MALTIALVAPLEATWLDSVGVAGENAEFKLILISFCNLSAIKKRSCRRIIILLVDCLE